MIPIIIYLLLSILLGAVSCLFGKRLYFPILMLAVFSAVVTISFSLFDLTLKVGVITVIIGVIAAMISRFIYKLGVFFIGGILGGSLGLLAILILPSSAEQFSGIVVLLFIVAAGICAVKWCDFFIMASTSVNGAFKIAVPVCFLFTEYHNLQNFIYADGMVSTVTNLDQYLNNQFAAENGTNIFLLTLIIAIGGFFFQVIMNRKQNSIVVGNFK